VDVVQKKKRNKTPKGRRDALSKSQSMEDQVRDLEAQMRNSAQKRIIT
jgi:hypothetical protein